MHQIKFITLLIVFLQIFISLAFANASSKLENNLKLSKLINLENPWGMDLIDSGNILISPLKLAEFSKTAFNTIQPQLFCKNEHVYRTLWGCISSAF